MSKKNNKPHSSQVLGITWISIGLLIVGGIVFFSSSHQPAAVENSLMDSCASTILMQKEDSVYMSRRSERRTNRKEPVSLRQSRPLDTARPLYTNAPAPQRKQPLSIELNSADTLTLQLLHGIGPAFARRIVRYRERLGGFVSASQLLEVYGFTPELLAHIEPHLWVDSTAITPIAINSIGLKELARHPYMEYYQARDIVRLRSMGVVFGNADDLRAVPSMADSTMERIVPYIDFSPQNDKNRHDAQ